MALDLDLHHGLDSPLHRLEPRCRLIGLGLLIGGFSAVRQPLLLAPMLLVAGLILVISRLPIGFVLRRLRAPGVFVLVLGLMLAFVVGDTELWRMGPVAMRLEGLGQMMVIVCKLLAVVTTGLVLLGVAPLPTTVNAMRRLGLPSLLADMAILSYRYIHEIGDDLRSMRTAARLRGFSLGGPGPGAEPACGAGDRPSRRSGDASRRRRWWSGSVPSTLATLVGSLLVTSHARAEQVYRAMVLRGYGGRQPIAESLPLDWLSVLVATGLSAVGVSFVLAEWLLRS